ncbi:hypothetical protein DL89DRAFT_292517 [Linderina pennispora]|uniref:Arrestin-like N-terminal domain-containing protein n=1 Tax=Linderina pennispora TaxID=61395 RepID=A0A1Y1WBQ2_9FUNG|nr:uncharacterized protein DL89DRAFT_292517 [Linderina pennispora]ORX70959.1 hypothetical protein DL89DRAFT_292517 [Linderina pennispora]
MSKVADEYEIKYTLSARIIGSRGVRDPLQTTTHNVIFVPETISPFDTVDPNARYRFCDNALDHSGSWVYHLQAMGIQQAFAPGDSVDFQLRLTGNRTLRKAQYVLVEQTDCFYPQLPSDPSEELMDLGRRLWSTERLLSTASDMYFGRDSVVVPDLCAEHMNSRRARGGSTYYGHLHTMLPTNVSVMHETGYLRITYYVLLTLHSSSNWGQTKRAQVRIPIPVASRVLPDNASPESRFTIASPPIYSKRSSIYSFARREPSTSSRTDADTILEPAWGAEDPSLRRGRSIVDLGNKLNQFIPRRTVSGMGHLTTLSTPRIMSVARLEPSWSVADLLSGLPASTGQPRLVSATRHLHALPQLPAPPPHGCYYSKTFLSRLREFYHIDADRAGLRCLISGIEPDPNDVIPNGVPRSTPQQGSGQRASCHRVSVLSMSAGSDRIRPKLEAVMTSFKNTDGHVSTWSALPRRASTIGKRSTMMSGISLESNDTAYIPNAATLKGTSPSLPATPLHPLLMIDMIME